MPAATHLTASTLSSTHPTVTFDRTRIHTMPYGEQDVDGGSGREVAIGSLDLTLTDEQPSLFGTGAHVLQGAGEAIGIETGAYGRQGDEIRLPHASADLMIMNPPFTSPTNHAAMYSASTAFAVTAQQRMSEARASGRLEYPAGHGNAGLASNFIDLAHAPSTSAARGHLGQRAPTRRLLARAYRNLVVVTIAAAGKARDQSFSSDTGIGEALVVAVKRANQSRRTRRRRIRSSTLATDRRAWRRPPRLRGPLAACRTSAASATRRRAASSARLWPTAAVPRSGGRCRRGRSRAAGGTRACRARGRCPSFRSRGWLISASAGWSTVTSMARTVMELHAAHST